MTLYGHGLYRYDTVGMATQAQAADFVTLALGLPLLAISAWLAVRGSLRGRLLLSGTLGYFLYTYLSLAFLAAYNQLFLVSVALLKMLTLGMAVSAMALNMLWSGVAISPVELLVFSALTLASLALAAVLLKHVTPRLPEAASA